MMHGFTLQLRLCQGLIQGRDTDWRKPIATLHTMLQEIWGVVCDFNKLSPTLLDIFDCESTVSEREDDPKQRAKIIAEQCFTAGNKLEDEVVAAYVNSVFSCNKSDLSVFKQNLVDELHKKRQNVKEFGSIGEMFNSISIKYLFNCFIY